MKSLVNELKAIILAGGLGTRLSEETSDKPKPMIKIGPFTLIEHIMDIYAKSDITEFIIATGYKGEIIHQFFDSYSKYKVTCLDTGEKTQTGGRIKRVFESVYDETLCATYGDGLGNIPVRKVIDFHRSHKKIATVTAVRPPARFGRLSIENEVVIKFGEKLQSEEGWINGGFFVFNRAVKDYIDGDEDPLEAAPLAQITKEGELMAYMHQGFWARVDTLREKMDLENLLESGHPSWLNL
jgi:glucose-1-phosphate cytidylyltransferase